jgi:hypothetical protein
MHLRGTHGFRVDFFTVDPRFVVLDASRWASPDNLSVNNSSFAAHPRSAFDAGRLT